MTQAGHITVVHGNLTVDVPRRIFKGRECRIDEEAAGPFHEMIRGRYPWLSEGSVDVLLSKAQREMVRVLDEETNGKSHSAVLAQSGRLDEAIAHMRRHIEADPQDPDSWYALGELLCQAGDAAEGYKAINRGSELALESQRRGRSRRRRPPAPWHPTAP